MDFDSMLAARSWTPIRRCPGRYGLAAGAVTESPEAITGEPGQEFHARSARDLVVVVQFAAGGGLISYKRADGTFVHTLNSADGLERKLRELEIVLRSAF